MSSRSQEIIGFSYLDVAKQEEFVKMFGKVPSSLRRCEDGGKARPVSYVFARRWEVETVFEREKGRKEGGRGSEREREGGGGGRETDRRRYRERILNLLLAVDHHPQEAV